MMQNYQERAPVDVADIRVSAIQLAELAGLRPEDIHYWARKKLIKRSANGSKRPFAMSDLPKVSLMGELTRRFGMEAAKAAALTDDLLRMYEDEPDSYVAALGVLEAFDKSMGTLARVLADVGFIDALIESGLVEETELAYEPVDVARGRKKEPG